MKIIELCEASGGLDICMENNPEASKKVAEMGSGLAEMMDEEWLEIFYEKYPWFDKTKHMYLMWGKK